MMNAYEMITILTSNVTDETRDEFIQKMKDLIGAEVDVTVEDWGRKKLAYEIKKQNEGYYLMFTFSSNPSDIAEMERVLRLNDTVLKHMVIKK
ncbi:MAG: 30S ribosomal protein S6 [Clostridia bacterium]